MFSAHKLINYSTEPADSFTLAMYIDFDLGCYRDDYIGCHPATNTVFGYNRTNTDLAAASCDGVLSFGDNPPVQAVTFLNKGLDYFIPIFNASVGNPPAATTDPTLPNQYFNYLHGHWCGKCALAGKGRVGMLYYILFAPVEDFPTFIRPENPRPT